MHMMILFLYCFFQMFYGIGSTNITININFTNTIYTLNTTPTLQIVLNPLLTRVSPIYNNVYKMLSDLSASYVRYSSWFPYAHYGVAQLYPPSNKYLCTHLNGDANNNNWTTSISCPLNSSIKSIDFVSWGNPKGYCGNFSFGNCNSNNVLNTTKQLCLHQNTCIIPVNSKTFHDNCPNITKQFALQIQCSIPYNYSNYNFTLVDQVFSDVMNAINPNNIKNKTIINFSAIPNWFYQNVSYGSGINDNPWIGSSYNGHGNNIFLNNKTTPINIGKYFSNIINYYKNGEFMDEYGNKYISNYNYTIDHWEILNEPKLQGNTPQSYTILYDNIVNQIKLSSEKNNDIKFVGMATSDHATIDWYEYFLNHSNHNPINIPIDWISFHHYIHLPNGTVNNQFFKIFDDVDNWIKNNVTKIISLRDKLSPNTQITIDEIGILTTDNSNKFDNLYWVANGG
eukprot:270768_1